MLVKVETFRSCRYSYVYDSSLRASCFPRSGIFLPQIWLAKVDLVKCASPFQDSVEPGPSILLTPGLKTN